MRVWMLPLGCAVLATEAFAQRLPGNTGAIGAGSDSNSDFGTVLQILAVLVVLGSLAVVAFHLVKIVANLFWLLMWVFSGRRVGRVDRIKGDLGDSFKAVASAAVFALVIGGPIACLSIVNR